MLRVALGWKKAVWAAVLLSSLSALAAPPAAFSGTIDGWKTVGTYPTTLPVNSSPVVFGDIDVSHCDRISLFWVASGTQNSGDVVVTAYPFFPTLSDGGATLTRSNRGVIPRADMGAAQGLINNENLIASPQVNGRLLVYDVPGIHTLEIALAHISGSNSVDAGVSWTCDSKLYDPVTLDGESSDKLTLSAWGIWWLAGIAICLLFAREWHAAWKWWSSR